MKKRLPVFLLILLAFMAFASFRPLSEPISQTKFARRFIQTEEIQHETVSNTLPSSLQFIDDEAFEGTALQRLVLPDSVTEVGDRAFANNKDLMMIRFPDEIEQIGEEILVGSDKAVMEVYAGSDALSHAKGKGYRYHVMTAFGVEKTARASAWIAGSSSVTHEYEQQRSVCPAETRSRRTGRTAAELKGEMYRGIASLYIQSRYFP